MSQNLSLTNKQSNFAFIPALVFSRGKPEWNWFKATVGDSMVMVFLPDDGSITKEMIEPGDTLYIAGMQRMEGDGFCTHKANCAPFVLQIDALKRSIEYRFAKQDTVETVEIAKQEIPVQQSVEPADVGEKPRVTITDHECAQFVAYWCGAKNYKDARAASKAVMDIIRAAMRAGIKPE